MLAFILISDRFGEPISRAAKGERYNDDDAFGLMNFQIDQWIKKAVRDYNMDDYQDWATNPSTRPPAWAILLNLRAQSVRSLILKPFFFPECNIEASKCRVRPATELIYETINVLHTLDTTTDIYRKQHPLYQHILACAFGLASLLIVFLIQNRASMLPILSPNLIDSLDCSLEMAVSLNTKYTEVSRSARRLAKRLAEVRKAFTSLTTTSAGVVGADGSPRLRQDVSNHDVDSFPQPQPVSRAFYSSVPALQMNNRGMVGGMGLGLSATGDDGLQMGWADSLRFTWPMGEMDNIFSESLF